MARPSYEHIGRAIAGVRTQAKFTQTHLAERLRSIGWPIDQSRLSKWERGVEAPAELDIYPAIERMCGAPLGTIFRQAGYVAENSDGADLKATIMADSALNETAKLFLVDFYESALRRSAADAKL